jgi:putative NADH-flavin reductase
MSEIHTIAVIGGSGKAGQYIIRELVARGFKVKALLRTPEKLPFENPLLTKLKGDVRTPIDVLNLLNGCDALLSALGQTKNELPVFSEGSRNIISAMNKLGLKRYIAVTGLSIDVPTDKKSFRTKLLSWIMKVSFPAIIKDKQEEYSLLSMSNLDWTLFRLPMIELSDRKDEVVVNLADCPGKKISTGSLALFLVDQLPSLEYSGQSPFLADKE